ncbi:MAG TPA: NUDIX hydrolase [Bryobacteraceae bacterium]|nr:NUDIX hydrolase [Bryobacteraceae bacterium]
MAIDRRRYPKRPILGVGALIFRHNRILLVERAREPLKGCWSLPGGVLETGERLEEGIRREVREETGLEVKPVALATIFERIINDDKGRAEYHYVLIDYICRIIGGTPAAASDVSAIAWVQEQDLSDYKLTEGTLPVIQAAFQTWQSAASQSKAARARRASTEPAP